MSFEPTDLPPHFHVEVEAIQDLLVERKARSRYVIYTILCYHLFGRYGSGNQVWPSYGTLAKESGYHRSVVIEAIKDLVKWKWIKIIPPPHRTSNTYLLIRRPLLPEHYRSNDQVVGQGLPGRAEPTPPVGQSRLPGSAEPTSPVGQSRPEEQQENNSHESEELEERAGRDSDYLRPEGVSMADWLRQRADDYNRKQREAATTDVNGTAVAHDNEEIEW